MEVVLHLGAHKTASAYLQSRLSANGQLLRSHGAFCVPLPFLRREVTGHIGPVVRGLVFGSVARRRLRAGVERMLEDTAGPHLSRLVLSDPDILGDTATLVDKGAFYATVRERLGALADALPMAPATIMLSIRGYADFFAAAYGQRLRDGVHRRFDDEMRARLTGVSRGWIDVIHAVSETFPGARLIVWQHEMFGAVEPALFDHLVGRDAARWLAPCHDWPMRGLSARAVTELQDRADAFNRIAEEDRAFVLRAHPRRPGTPGFDPWTDAERAALDTRYIAELPGIAAICGEDFLDWRAAA